MQKVKVCGKIASSFLIYSLSLSIFHYFGGYFRMRNFHYFRRLFSRYSYRSPGRPSEIEDLQKIGFDFVRFVSDCSTEITTKFRKN